jgi:hypothetical protein
LYKPALHITSGFVAWGIAVAAAAALTCSHWPGAAAAHTPAPPPHSRRHHWDSAPAAAHTRAQRVAEGGGPLLWCDIRCTPPAAVAPPLPQAACARSTRLQQWVRARACARNASSNATIMLRSFAIFPSTYNTAIRPAQSHKSKERCQLTCASPASRDTSWPRAGPMRPPSPPRRSPRRHTAPAAAGTHMSSAPRDRRALLPARHHNQRDRLLMPRRRRRGRLWRAVPPLLRTRLRLLTA